MAGVAMRVGCGFDVHALCEGRKLVLGGVEIPHDRGLLGHSDADCLLHAIIDALLGALALGDIGTWFPDSDERYKDIASTDLFNAVWKHVSELGWEIVNCDTVVMAEKPKLKPHVESIRLSLAKLFSCAVEQVSVKATTFEKLGFIGQEKGISAQAIVLLNKST